MDDLISRQAAIDAIDVLKRNYPSSCFEDLCKAVDIAIKALSARSERKIGHWVNVRDNNIADCDRCNARGRAWMNFCPICGADMRGEQNG